MFTVNEARVAGVWRVVMSPLSWCMCVALSCLGFVSCDGGSSPPPDMGPALEPVWTETAQTSESLVSTAQPSSVADAGAVVQEVEISTDDGTGQAPVEIAVEVEPTSEPTVETVIVADVGVVEPIPFIAPAPTLIAHSLKEQFQPSSFIERRVREHRRYDVVVNARLATSASGASQVIRRYQLEVNETLGGVIQSGTFRVLEDVREAISPDGEPRPRPSSGQLEGLGFSCHLGEDSGYYCDVPQVEGHRPDLTGLIPQRLGWMPEFSVLTGESWEISGRRAELFLGVEGASGRVRFVFDQLDASYRGVPCYRVSYSLSGEQPVHLSGRSLMAEMEGEGYYMYSPEDALVLHHHQERRLSAEYVGTPQLTRTEVIIYEEETFPSVE